MFDQRVVVLPPAFLPSATWYAALMSAPVAVIDVGARYDKRDKSVHRTNLVDTHGPQTLTIPVARPESTRTSWDTVNVSAHGEWWRTVRSTLATVFGPTPFFEYYRDDFDHLLAESAVGQPVTDLDTALDAVVRRLLGLTTRVSASLDPRCRNVIDLRGLDFDVATLTLPGAVINLPAELAPGVTILDPIFRLGGDETRRLLEASITTADQ